jgi:hypothetical protein
MSNTRIVLHSSGVSGNIPSLGVIEHGELALNFADGALYYKTEANTIGTIRTAQPAGLTTEVQFNDAGSFGSDGGLSFNKTTKKLDVAGEISGGRVVLSNAAGYIEFADGTKQYTANAGPESSSANTGNISFSDTTLTAPINSPIVLSAINNTTREARLLLSPTGTSELYASGVLVVGVNFGTGSELYWTFGADGSLRYPDGTSQYSAAPIQQAIDDANTANNNAITAGIYANAAFDAANTANVNAISAGLYANAAFDAANSANVVAISSGIYANAAFDAANTANVNAISAGLYANAAFGSANSSGVYANAAFNQANTANLNSISAGVYANAAFDTANQAFTQSSIARTHANAAFDTANSVGVTAQAAFDAANTKYSSSGGTISGDVTITGNLNITGNTVTHSADDFIINDPIVLMANNNPGNLLDIGFVAHYEDGSGNTKHTGLVRDVSQSVWYLLEDYIPHIQEDNMLDPDDPSLKISTLKANLISNSVIVTGDSATTNTSGAVRVDGGIGVKGNVVADAIIFPDGTKQTTAATGEGGGSVTYNTALLFTKANGTTANLFLRVADSQLTTALNSVYVPFIKADGTVEQLFVSV